MLPTVHYLLKPYQLRAKLARASKYFRSSYIIEWHAMHVKASESSCIIYKQFLLGQEVFETPLSWQTEI